MKINDKIVEIASKEIGYKEGNNKSNKYGKWYGLDCANWCMMFVQWVYSSSGISLPYKTASCGDFLRWVKRNMSDCIKKEPTKGCIVIFDFPKTNVSTDHTGIFVALDGQNITTIDGNTSSANDSSGGHVQIKTRRLSYANPVYIVFNELLEDRRAKVDEFRFNSIDDVIKFAPWAKEAVKKMIDKEVIKGNGNCLDLSKDMLRMFVYLDRLNLI